MKYSIIFILAFVFQHGHSQDTTFWELTADFEPGQKGSLKHEWGSETVTYLGTVIWKSPSGKELELRIVTTYRKITQANGFNDQSIVALVKTNNQLIKAYDFVKRQNLPLEIRNNQLVFKPDGSEIISPLPAKFGVRFCVEGMICYDEVELGM